jgi:A/G-specific adenine glycosylase
MMLQQTQTATVIPYYREFLSRYPTVLDLARADRKEILGLWAGLGYYRRAHLLHDAARIVAEEHDGQFPQEVADLLKLPGVGRYTAGAIASIAFDRRAPILDGNVKRVLARLTASEASPDDPGEIRRLWQLAEDILPARNCGAFNEALMDLGATVCMPKNPNCAACPLAAECTARLRDMVDRIPPPRKRAKVQTLELVCCLVIGGADGQHILVGARPPRGLWAGAWTPPAQAVNGASGSTLLAQLVPAAIARRMPAPTTLGTVRHQLTHRAVEFTVLTGAVARIRLPAQYRWHRRDDLRALPTAFRKVVQLLDTQPVYPRSSAQVFGVS